MEICGLHVLGTIVGAVLGWALAVFLKMGDGGRLVFAVLGGMGGIAAGILVIAHAPISWVVAEFIDVLVCSGVGWVF